MKIIDLRSDTVTLPTPAMREAIARAELGDDVFGEDPTVNRLEAMAAEMLGKEAALLTASGTMSNLLAILTHTQRGDEIIVGSESHIFLNEVGGASALGGVHVRTVRNLPDGTMDPAEIEAAIRAENIHYPTSRLLCLENTHNRCGGAALSPEQTRTLIDVARRHGLKVHIDGARIFNAAVALKVDVKALVCDVDSVCFSLSKGLACPVGSILVGSREFIARARKFRKMLGGGMRQAGIIAAAGIVALETMIDRLEEDHENARRLAEGIKQIPGLRLAQPKVETNIIFVEVLRRPVPEFVAEAARRGIKLAASRNPVRMVTHYGITCEDIDYALKVFAEIA